MVRQYISAGMQYNTREKHVNAPLFRKCFDVKKSYTTATLQISAVGFYRIFLNGKDITKGFFAPYISNPDDVVYYDDYDISSCLQEHNVICVLLGNGIVNSLDNNVWLNEAAPYRSAPKVHLALSLDGQTILTTDESFSVCNSPILFDDLRCGEHFDARLIKVGILEPDYIEDEDFFNAIIVDAPKGNYLPCKATPVVAHERLQAVKILPSQDGFIYDFGQNNTGLCLLKIDAEEGQKITLVYGEVLQNGQLDLSNISFGERSVQGYVQQDEYITKQGYQEYLPSFTFHGFRYVYVQGITKQQATSSLLEYVVIHSQMPIRGRFYCDNQMVNKIQQCTLASDTSGFVYFPMDCPQREKNGWTADASLSAEQMLYNFDCGKSLQQWLYSIRKAQTEKGALPGIVPNAGWGYEWGNGPAWDSVLIELPYQLYKIDGNTQVICENADAICKYFDYLQSKLNADGLLSFGLGDWCEAGTLREEDFSTPVEVTDTLVTVNLAHKSAQMLHIIGRAQNARQIETFGNTLRQRFRQKYLCGSRISCDTQTAQAMAISVGVFNDDEIAGAYRYLLQLLQNANNHFRVGVVGIQHLLNVLADGGYGDLALQLITQPTFPSYAYNVNLGATTLWEAFNEYLDIQDRFVRKDGGRILSLNHHFWGGVSSWFYKYLGGLRLVSCKQAVVAPLFLENVGSAYCEFAANGGKIVVKWKRRENQIELTVESVDFDYQLQLSKKYKLSSQKNIQNVTTFVIDER